VIFFLDLANELRKLGLNLEKEKEKEIELNAL